MNITTISGINSFALYITDKKYFFFGDLHGDNLNNCDDQYHCDYFNYNFTKILSHNTSCSTIGPLLKNWLDYNHQHHISTTFLLEKSYGPKSNVIDPVFNHLITHRENYDTLSTIFPYKMSWLQLVVYLAPTFAIPSDNIDIRFYDNVRASPFHLQFLYSLNISDHELKNFTNIYIKNYRYILKSILIKHDDQLYRFILSKLKNEFKIAYEQYLSNMNPLINIVSDTLSSLSNPKLSQQIINFIMMLADEHMQDVKMDMDLDYYVTVFTVLAAYTFDAYVLAKMFLSTDQEVIVYAGAAHIEVYNLFFQNYITYPIYETEAITNNKCITFNDLPKYLKK